MCAFDLGCVVSIRGGTSLIRLPPERVLPKLAQRQTYLGSLVPTWVTRAVPYLACAVHVLGSTILGSTI